MRIGFDINFNEVLERMIAEQGVTVWAHTEGVDRSDLLSGAVVVTDDPRRCFRLVCPDVSMPNVWHTHEATMDAEEMADFFAAFGSHWRILLGARIGEQGYRVRAFIRNGRRKGHRWSISVDLPQPETNQTVAA